MDLGSANAVVLVFLALTIILYLFYLKFYGRKYDERVERIGSPVFVDDSIWSILAHGKAEEARDSAYEKLHPGEARISVGRKLLVLAPIALVVVLFVYLVLDPSVKLPMPTLAMVGMLLLLAVFLGVKLALRGKFGIPLGVIWGLIFIIPVVALVVFGIALPALSGDTTVEWNGETIVYLFFALAVPLVLGMIIIWTTLNWKKPIGRVNRFKELK